MPSASGVYSLPPGYLAVTGQPILASQHNPPFEDVAAALTLRLSRDGSAPMTGPLKAIAGSAAIPSMAFSTDPSTGTFKTNNGIGVAVGGAQVAEFTSAGLASGVWITGQIIAWSGTSLPSALWVFPAGQTLSRTAYPKLWAFAQVEIAAGNTFYNNGDGSTTFGIGDLRGRTIAAIDNMGGTDAGLLSGSSVAANRTKVGGAGGTSTITLSASQIPSITSNVSVTGTLTGGTSTFLVPSGFTTTGGGGFGASASPNTLSIGVSVSGTLTGGASSSNTGGGAADNLQPTLLCNFLLFAGS